MDMQQKRKLREQPKNNRPSPPIPLPNPIPPPPRQYAQGPLFSWWDIENVPIPKWLEPEDVLRTFRATFSSLGYQGKAEINVVVESSTSEKQAKTTKAKWAVLAKPGSGFKYMDCRANPPVGRTYEEGEKNIADEEILRQLGAWTPPHQMGTTVVLFTGDFLILNECERLRNSNINVIVVPVKEKIVKDEVLVDLRRLGIPVIEWEWFLIYAHHYGTTSEKPRTEDGDGDGDGDGAAGAGAAGAASAMNPIPIC